MSPGGDITIILKRWSVDRSAVLEQLTPVVYEELRKIAAGYLSRERKDHTLQPTALINEAWLRLSRQNSASLEDRSHFYGMAARLMRQILVDSARSRQALKRGSGNKMPLDDEIALPHPGGNVNFLALNEALEKFAGIDPRAAEILELRYFGGLQLDEIAQQLSVSLATVKRGQALAEAWLRRALSGD